MNSWMFSAFLIDPLLPLRLTDFSPLTMMRDGGVQIISQHLSLHSSYRIGLAGTLLKNVSNIFKENICEIFKFKAEPEPN